MIVTSVMKELKPTWIFCIRIEKLPFIISTYVKLQDNLSYKIISTLSDNLRYLVSEGLIFAKRIVSFLNYLLCRFSSESFIINIFDIIWGKVFKNGPSKICVRQPLKNFT